MVAASKNSVLKEIMPEFGCKEIYHPWNPSCLASVWGLYQESLKGSAQFCALLYTVSHLDISKCWKPLLLIYCILRSYMIKP